MSSFDKLGSELALEVQRCRMFSRSVYLTYDCPFQMQAKYGEAEPLYERSQAIREKALGPEHPDVASSLYNRAVLLSHQVVTWNSFFTCCVCNGNVSCNVIGHSLLIVSPLLQNRAESLAS